MFVSVYVCPFVRTYTCVPVRACVCVNIQRLRSCQSGLINKQFSMASCELRKSGKRIGFIVGQGMRKLQSAWKVSNTKCEGFMRPVPQGLSCPEGREQKSPQLTMWSCYFCESKRQTRPTQIVVQSALPLGP